MPEMDVGQVKFLEEQSLDLAETDGKISQMLATVGAAVSLSSPSQAAILGVGAALTGLLGNYRLAMGADTGRDDIETVRISSADLDPSKLPTDPLMRVLSRFGAQLVLVSDALFAVLRAMQRQKATAGNPKAAAAQLDAVRRNGQIAANMQEMLAILGDQANDAIETLMASGTSANLTLASVQSFYRKCLGDPPGSGLQLVAQAVTGAADTVLQPFDFDRANPILSASALPDLRFPIFDKSWRAGLGEISTTLRNLVDG